MDYHLYFHSGCFDGAMSAALLTHFFRWRGDDVASLNPVSYQPDFKEVWTNYSFKHPLVVVDFRYHPQADWWFDHHLTSFLSPEWEANFKNDRQHYFDPDYPSCYGMALNFLRRTYQYQPTPTLVELEPWLDKIDSANYQSAEEAISVDSWVQELMLLLVSYDEIDPLRYDQLQREVIEAVVKGEVQSLLDGPYRSAIEQFKGKLRQAIELYKQKAVIKGKISFLDQTDLDILYSDFIGYYLFPQLPYVVSISKGDSGFHLHVGRNPWFKPASDLHIGTLIKKYGGGGHEGVGGGNIAAKEEALKIAEEIIEYLNQHG